MLGAVWVPVGLLLGEGAYIMANAAVLGTSRPVGASV
jgi:hypothetical protein